MDNLPGVQVVTMASSGTGSALRANRNWRRLWLGQAVSLTGDYVFATTVLLWVATVIARGRPWAPAAASGVLIAAAVPVLVIGPAAGVYVDRWNRRRIMMTADACRAVLIASLLLLPAFGHQITTVAELAAIYGIVAAEGAFAQFFNPSRLAVLGAVVAPGDLPSASGLLQATSSLAGIIGPPLAAPLLFTLGVQWALLIDASSFALSFLAIRAIQLPGPGAGGTPATPSFRAEFRAGIRFFARSRALIALCVGVVIATLGTGALNTLMVFFVTGNLHTAARWLGILFAGVDAGAIAGALLAGRMARRIGAARVFCLGLIVGGGFLLAFSRITLFPVAVAVGALVGFVIGAINAAAPPLFLAIIPQHLIGRVMAVFNPLQQIANIVSMGAAGFLASTLLRGMHVMIAGMTFGPIDAILGVSALLIIAGGIAVTALLNGARHPYANGEIVGPGSSPGPGPSG
jgi:MFS family permease